MKKHNIIYNIIVLILAISFLALPVSAATEKNEEYWGDLSCRTGIPAIELQNSYLQMSKEDFETAVIELEELMQYYKSLPNYGISLADASPMSDSQWRQFKSTMVNGSVLITQDSEHLNYYHGHAAIVSGVYDSTVPDPLNRVIYITEHPGSKDNGALSWRIILNNNTTNYWRTRSNVVNMHYGPSSNTMNTAGNVATTSYIIGKPYNPLADKNSATTFSCSSLVYRCYLEAGADVGGDSGSIVMPIHIAQDSDMIIRYLYGDFPWY